MNFKKFKNELEQLNLKYEEVPGALKIYQHLDGRDNEIFVAYVDLTKPYQFEVSPTFHKGENRDKIYQLLYKFSSDEMNFVY